MATSVVVPLIEKTLTSISFIPTFRGLPAPKSVGDALKIIFGTDPSGFTPLHHAVASSNLDLLGHILTVSKLLASSPVPLLDPRDRIGRTPLHMAIARVDAPTIIRLVDNGANVNAMAADGSTPLHVAVSTFADASDQKTVDTMVRYLLDRGADPTLRTLDGQTPLHLAAQVNAPALIETLIELGGAPINAVDDEGENSLFYAIRSGAAEAVSCLFNYKIDRLCRNESQETPAMCARALNDPKMVALFEDSLAASGFAESGSALHFSSGLDNSKSMFGSTSLDMTDRKSVV